MNGPLIPGEWAILLSALLLGLGLFLCWRGTARCSKKLRMILLGLRSLSLLLGCLLLFNPGHWKSREQAGEKHVALLFDHSESMATRDVAGKTRLAAGLGLPLPESDDLRSYALGEQVWSLSDRRELSADSPSSPLRRSISQVLDQQRDKLRAIMLLSDGISTDGSLDTDLAARARAFNVPIYALPLGGEVEPADLAIEVLGRRHIAFLNQPYTVRARCSSTEQTAPWRGSVLLSTPEGEELDSKKITVDPGSRNNVELQFTPNKPGMLSCQLTIETPGSDRRSANDRDYADIMVLTNRVRCLVVEGKPSWDSKFLVQFLREQPHLETTAIYRTGADRNMMINPESASAEDQLKAFPKTMEELAAFDVILFGKGIEHFLDSGTEALLEKAVREQGLGLLFTRGKAYEGELPGITKLEPHTWGAPLSGSFLMQPVKGSRLFGDALPPADDPCWSLFPKLENANSVESLHSFAEVLTEGRKTPGSKPFPLLISRRYGRGMIMVVNGEGFWHWDFFPSAETSSLVYRDLWSQLILWMNLRSEFLPGMDYALECNTTSAKPNTAIGLQVRSRDNKTQGLKPRVAVYRDGQRLDIIELQEGRTNRSWQGVLTSGTPGRYMLELEDAAGQIPKGLRTVIEVTPPPTENDRLSTDFEGLRRFCEQTGGALIDTAGWSPILQQLLENRDEQKIGQLHWVPIWDHALLLILWAALLALEWTLRRRNGML